MKFVCRIILFSLLILGTSTTVVTESSQNLIRTSSLSVQDEFETLMEKIREDFAQNPLIDEALNKYDTTKGCFRHRLQSPRPHQLGTSHSHKPTV